MFSSCGAGIALWKCSYYDDSRKGFRVTAAQRSGNSLLVVRTGIFQPSVATAKTLNMRF